MLDINSFAIIGGDKRQIALAESIVGDGYNAYAVGFDNINFRGKVQKTTLVDAVERCVNIILPLPVTTDGHTLNMVYSNEKVILDDGFAELMKNKQVFGGMMGKLYQTSEVWESIDTFDYYTREEFAVQNAIPTSEGAIEIAIHEYPGTISGSNCLVVGFGRIGKTLSRMLHGIGANVTVACRKPSDLAWVNSFGYTAVKTEELCEQNSYDIIFNTAPAMIFNRRILSKLQPETLIIDLSSMPGGVDFETAKKLGIKTVHALSLPGIVAPKTAGEIIKNTIYHIMEE
ncbi:MAG: dipicolinate synthase subunit DpsA [Ruminococcaceae bacterium]|nr:dipicolinate synthase subunit DpsA [Oscillospiraceae bacterium]